MNITQRDDTNGLTHLSLSHSLILYDSNDDEFFFYGNHKYHITISFYTHKTWGIAFSFNLKNLNNLYDAASKGKKDYCGHNIE